MFRRVPRLLGAVVAVAGLALPLAACGGGGSSGKTGTRNDSDLAVLHMDHALRTDVYRNQQIRLKLTAPVKKSTLNRRTVRIMTGPNLQTPAEGALYVDPASRGDVIVFDPVRTQALVDRQGPNALPVDRPFGFEPLANYQVFVPAPPAGKYLKNRAGDPIVSEFTASFSTSDKYIPELVPPKFVGIDGNGSLGFSPERNADGSVPFDAHILLEFSEPIDPATMSPGVTVLVQNLSVLDKGQPTAVPGTFRAGNDGRTYFFVPSFHYGTGPYEISVTLTQEIRDLAGNPLANPRTLRFTTENNPDVDTVAVISEPFDNTLQFDLFAYPPAETAEWDGAVDGELRGGAITTTLVEVDKIGDNVVSRNLLVDWPLASKSTKAACVTAFPNGVHTQHSFVASQDLNGVKGAITVVAWGPDSNALFAATHDNLQIRLGHGADKLGKLAAKFEDNWASGVPLPSYDGSYSIPQIGNFNPNGDDFWPYPTLTTPFEYDGESSLILDFALDAASDCQTHRVWFHGLATASDYPGVRTITAMSKAGTKNDYPDNFYPAGHPMIYDTRFTFRRRITMARSKFYRAVDLAKKPNWADPILTPPVQPGGAQATVEWQGADGMPHPTFPWLTIADESTASPWSSSIDIADDHQFIRFRVTMTANLNSETVPRFQQIQMPYSFRPGN